MSPAAIPVITLVVSSVATAYSVYAQQQASSLQDAIAKRNADAAEKAARDAEARGLNEGVKVGLAGGVTRGALRAGVGASGVEVGSGSALDVLSDAAMFNELDKQTTQDNARREAAGFLNQKGNFLLQNQLDQSSASSGQIGTLLTGASSAAGNYYNQTHKV